MRLKACLVPGGGALIRRAMTRYATGPVARLAGSAWGLATRVAATAARGLPMDLGASRRRRDREAAANDPAPNLTAEEKQCLLGLARSVVTHRLAGKSEARTAVAARGLFQRRDPVFVTFWVDGRMRGCQGATDGSLFQNTVKATERTLRDERVSPLTLEDLDRLRIELEVLGPFRPLRARRLKRFGQLIEPGIHGVMAEKGGQRAIFKSSVAITKNWRIGELIPRLCEKGGWSATAYRHRGPRFSRFRSTSFIEAEGGRTVCDLLRANRLVEAGDWSSHRIADALRQGAECLVRWQRADGGFAYQYAPAEGRGEPGDNLVRQVATVWLMQELARRFGTARYGDAARHALGFVAAHTRPGPGSRDTAIVATDAREASLGATAFGLLAVAAAGDESMIAQGRRFAEAILSLQQANGRFLSYFPPSRRDDAQEYFPGEAMLALMHFHARHPDPRYPEALRRAFPYYRDHFRSAPSTAFPPWQIAAHARLFRITGERAHADFVFEMTDWLLARQYTGSNAPYPDYVGGYATGRVPGISSATYNEGVLDAYDLAGGLAERERAARYQRAAVTAVLFTLRLQFTRHNSFFVRDAERVRGGFRTSLADSTMRIDHTQHALNSLLKAERLFWPAGVREKGGDRIRSPMGSRPASAALDPAAPTVPWTTTRREGDRPLAVPAANDGDGRHTDPGRKSWNANNSSSRS